MSTPAQIIDGTGTRNKVKVSGIGQLITAPYNYDDVVFKELAEPNIAYNFFPPKANEQFVITGIVLVADRQVSSTVNADVIIYEADTENTITTFKTLFRTAMVQDQSFIILPINILVTQGKYVNGKTTDDDIHVTLMGNYIPEVS